VILLTCLPWPLKHKSHPRMHMGIGRTPFEDPYGSIGVHMEEYVLLSRSLHPSRHEVCMVLGVRAYDLATPGSALSKVRPLYAYIVMADGVPCFLGTLREGPCVLVAVLLKTPRSSYQCQSFQPIGAYDSALTFKVSKPDCSTQSLHLFKKHMQTIH
jgi:hypothetical protein